MPFDLQVIQPKQLISVRSVTPLTDQVVRIIGSDFRSIESLSLNQQNASFFVEGPLSLLAQLPSGLRASNIESIEAVSRELSLTDTNKIFFRLNSQPNLARGSIKLVQGFLRLFLSEPGTDIFDPSLGAGALRNLGQNFSPSQAKDLISDMVISVDRARKQMANIQARHSKLPPDERILEAQLTRAAFDPSTASLVVTIRLVSQAGQLAFSNLTI